MTIAFRTLHSSLVAFSLAISVLIPVDSQTQAADAKQIESFLIEGKLAEGEKALTAELKAKPNDGTARFGLGIIQFLQAVEKLGQDQHRFGLLGNRRAALPLMRLPVGENDNPEKLTYEAARQIVSDFLAGLAESEATMAQVKPGDNKLRLKVGQIRLDLDGDGVATDEESFMNIMESVQRGAGRRRNDSSPDTTQFAIAFDDGDVLWLRGYCHVMGAFGEFVLAHDWKDQFERTAHLFYPNVESPYTYLQAEGSGPFNGFDAQNFLDLLALIHTINYECTEPDRMKSSLAHLESVIALSRESWKLINAETDDDAEWLPNTKQTAAAGGLQVSAEMQQQWNAFLNEAESILQGKTLLPFWRGVSSSATLFSGQFPTNPNVGINLRRVFTEPGRFDLVLWLQGPGLHPYLESGKVTDPEVWRNIQAGFRGEFLFFAAWFN